MRGKLTEINLNKRYGPDLILIGFLYKAGEVVFVITAMIRNLSHNRVSYTNKEIIHWSLNIDCTSLFIAFLFGPP